jgi:alcohol dehydrogenase class IV
MNDLVKAYKLLKRFKGDSYIFGMDISKDIPKESFPKGENIAIIRSTYSGSNEQLQPFQRVIAKQNKICAIITGPKPNAPLEDLERITTRLGESLPSFIVSFGGGSTTDIAKAANILISLGGKIDEYYGVALATQTIHKTGKSLLPHLAIQTSASSSAHLTKYANITDSSTHQKNLIVDDVIVPHKAIFDYASTLSAPRELTIDGALDGLSHAIEVYYGALYAANQELIEEVCLESIRLILHYLPLVLEHPDNKTARAGLAMGVDLGGYAIMLGSTNGGHLTSFSLVDILPHGRACAILNPYYTVFFAPTIHPQLKKIARLYARENFGDLNIPSDTEELGLYVAEAMQTFLKRIGVPTALNDVEGFSQEHINRALQAAQTPQLRMKINSMPVPFAPSEVETSMKSILVSAAEGHFEHLRSQF